MPGWDSAEFNCGSCGEGFTATNDTEFVRLLAEHKAKCIPIGAAAILTRPSTVTVQADRG